MSKNRKNRLLNQKELGELLANTGVTAPIQPHCPPYDAHETRTKVRRTTDRNLDHITRDKKEIVRITK